MADIAGVGTNTGFDAAQQTARVEERQRTADDDARLREEQQRQASQEQAQATTTEANTTQGVNETGAPATAGSTPAAEDTATDQSGRGANDPQDQVTLSSAAQDALAAGQTTAPPTLAAGEADAAPTTPANDTNQAVTLDTTTSTVRGNENNENEQVRALGQIVDQFA